MSEVDPIDPNLPPGPANEPQEPDINQPTQPEPTPNEPDEPVAPVAPDDLAMENARLAAEIDGLTVESFNEKLQLYNKAIEEEYALAQQTVSEDQTTDEAVEMSLAYFRKNIATAAATIVHLMNNSSSDGIKMNAAKYIIECVKSGAVDNKNDPVMEIIKGLKSRATQTSNN